MSYRRSTQVPVIARVECRSESRGEERPLAVWLGGERMEITETIDRAMVGGAEAGEPVRHRMWVEVENGDRYELIRTLPEGRWQVFRVEQG